MVIERSSQKLDDEEILCERIIICDFRFNDMKKDCISIAVIQG
jgi:hypothetical protein